MYILFHVPDKYVFVLEDEFAFDYNDYIGSSDPYEAAIINKKAVIASGDLDDIRKEINK